MVTFNYDKIIDRLKRFNYKYELNGETLKIYLPMFCYLKIVNKSGRVKMTSHLNFGFTFLPLEYNFLIYGSALYVFAWYNWATANKALLLLIGLVIIHFVICFIKIESLRIIIHKWIEEDTNN